MKTTIHSFQYPIGIDAGMGRVAVEKDYARHVEQMMLQLLFTNPGERINRPEFGCGLRRMVFAPNSDVTASLTQVTIYEALSTLLGQLIDVQDVKVQAKEEVLEVRIVYILKARQERRYLNLEVTI